MPWNNDRKPARGNNQNRNKRQGFAHKPNAKMGERVNREDADTPREDFNRKPVRGNSRNRNQKQGFEHKPGLKINELQYINRIEVDEQAEDNDRLEGRNSVLEALKAGRTFNKILLSKGDKEGSIKYIAALAREKGIILQEVERAKLDSISTTHSHQGVIAYVSPREYVEVDDIIQIAQKKGEPPFIIILDEITDPHNLGSILRTADSVGAHGVIIPKRRSVGLTASVSKASAGAIEYVPVARVTNLAQTIDYLKKQNIWVIGTDTTGEQAFFKSDLKGAVALVIGSEGEGMGKLVREKCDYVVNIPMKGTIASLNAAVAAGIVLYEILRQRGI